MFINYTPMNSTVSYPVKVAVVLISLGPMGEFYAPAGCYFTTRSVTFKRPPSLRSCELPNLMRSIPW